MYVMPRCSRERMQFAEVLTSPSHPPLLCSQPVKEGIFDFLPTKAKLSQVAGLDQVHFQNEVEYRCTQE
jgi:hypothetical protein